MSQTLNLNCCSRTTPIYTMHTNTGNRFSRCCEKNHDIIVFMVAAILATCAALFAYGYFPTCYSHLNYPMFMAGCLATMSASLGYSSILHALMTRGCITIERQESTTQV